MNYLVPNQEWAIICGEINEVIVCHITLLSYYLLQTAVLLIAGYETWNIQKSLVESNKTLWGGDLEARFFRETSQEWSSEGKMFPMEENDATTFPCRD